MNITQYILSKPELEYWLKGKNPLADYLADAAIKEADSYAAGQPWTRVIWDVTPISWLLDDERHYTASRLITAPVPSYDGAYTDNPNGHLMRYVFEIGRDELMNDLIEKLLQN